MVTNNNNRHLALTSELEGPTQQLVRPSFFLRNRVALCVFLLHMVVNCRRLLLNHRAPDWPYPQHSRLRLRHERLRCSRRY